VAKRRPGMRDRRSRRHLSVTDAAQVIAMAGLVANVASDSGASQSRRHIGAVAQNMLSCWNTSPIVVRVDNQFAEALLDSDVNVELVHDWLSRMPFQTLAFTFPVPVSLHDGEKLCHYVGFIATGMRTAPSGGPADSDGKRATWTTYPPLGEGDGVRFLWMFTEDGNPSAQAQTISVLTRGPLGKQLTLAELIDQRHAQTVTDGLPWGDELATLVPLSVQLVLYLTAQEPDLDWPAPETISRLQQLQHARVGHVGWRVGSTLRTWRRERVENPTGTGDPTTVAEPGRSWRLPPHIRKAHWHRVRIAVRDERGAVVGSRTGVRGADWDYEMRWYPPTLVNVDDNKPLPAVRAVDASHAPM